MITVTEKAAARLEEIIGQEHGKESAVRLYLSGVGEGDPAWGWLWRSLSMNRRIG